MVFTLKDDKNRTSPKLRKNPINNIKSKLYVLFLVQGKFGNIKKNEKILGNSKFEIFNNTIDFQRGFNQALFNMYYLAVNRGLGSDVKVLKVLNVGFSQADGVTTKRVKRRGKYYNYTYIKGVKGVVSVSRWSSKSNTIIDEEIKNITTNEVDDFIRKET